MNLVSLQTQAKSVSEQLVEAMLEMAGACWGIVSIGITAAVVLG